MAVVQGAWARDPYLRECTPSSIVQAAVQCVELGLDPSPQLGQFYMIPRNVRVGRGPNERWEKRATGQIGYKGLLAKVYESPRVLSADAELVRERDRFEIRRGTSPDVTHEYGLGERGQVIGGYAAARLAPADAVVPVWRVIDMTIADIESIRDRSDSYRKWRGARDNGKQWKEPPWVTDFAEMAKKTLLVRLCKMLPMGSAFARALEADYEELRTHHAPPDAPGPSRVDDLKAKIGAAPGDVVDGEFEEEVPE